MLRDLAQNIAFPDWAPQDSRYWTLTVNDLWLRAKFYNNIPYAFTQEQGGDRRALKLFQKRPSVRLNLPALGSKLVSRKLFAGRHAPRIIHENDKVIKALKWMVKASRLDLKMLEAAYWAQSGSIAMTFKIVDDIPCANYWCAQYCWPEFDDAERLSVLLLAYCVDGSEWLSIARNNGIGQLMDAEDNEVKPGTDYWYIRRYDKDAIWTMTPIISSSWNPVERQDHHLKPMVELFVPHHLDFIPSVWITAQPGGNDPDGGSIFHDELDSCITLDYSISQVGRGGNYASAPQLMVKGRILNYEKQGGVHIMGPSQMLQLPADRKDGDAAVSGADAKIIEMSATGLDVTMEKFVMHVKQWTMQAMSISRKDPDTITGQMSGKAMELIDEDFVDLVQVERTSIGEYGYLEAVKVMARMCIKEKHAQFSGVTDKMIDELELDWPSLYTPSPQDMQSIITSLTAAIDGGLLDDKEARSHLEKQIDKNTIMVDGQQNYKPTLKKKSDEKPAGKTGAK